MYEPIVRNDLPDFLTVFDFADPDVCTSQRNSTTVPAQSLWMMNSPFICERAEQLAERLLAGGEVTDAERVGQLYASCLGRSATEDEQQLALQFIAAAQQPSSTDADPSAAAAWEKLCHVLLASTEFRFVE
ncbi:MAG: DUF1553 domain-containing protein [Planctomycetaceae bacterium]|nr:DUF1553 domain-containing protein [Planctomycetaceae bacterium]